MKNSIVLTLVIGLEVIGNTCLSRGMRQLGAVDARAFANLWVILGVVLLLGYFLFFLTALSRLDLSYVLPMTASSYLLTSFMAATVLGETVPLSRWLGTALICAGILLVHRTERLKQGPPA